MSISDYPLARQLHADRTARIISEHRVLRRPTWSRSSLFVRKERRRNAARLAPSC
jgi:hypothetical protein